LVAGRRDDRRRYRGGGAERLRRGPLVDEEWFATARIIEPPAKAAISIRLDRDVIEWFKNNSERYQSKINAVLRSYIEA